MRIKKVSQTTPTQAQVVDGYSTSTTDAYSANYTNSLNTYSTTEQRIGTWTDDKPIYRKVFNVNLPSTTGWQTVASISNVDTIIDIRGQFTGADGRYMSVNHPETNYQTITSFLNGNIEVKCEAWYGRPVTIIVEYTKTTD